MIQSKVVVVGAGLAGLTTAYRLMQQGLDVQVYEARQRVGGRVLTAKIGNQIVELGAQNIGDGGKAENILKLIKECELELEKHQLSYHQEYFTGEKFIPVPQLLKELPWPAENIKEELNVIAQKSQNMREVLDAFLKESDPLYKFLSVRLAAWEGAPIEELSSRYVETLYYMLLGGVATVHQNQNNIIKFNFIKEGNALLPETLAQRLGNRVHLGKPLLKIARHLGQWSLKFTDEEIMADIVVLAIPCSLYSSIVFEMDVISMDRIKTMQSLKCGKNAKILFPLTKAPLHRKARANERISCSVNAQNSVVSLYYTGEASQFDSQTLPQAYEQEKPMLEQGFGDCISFQDPEYAQDKQFISYEGAIGYNWYNDPYAKGTYSYIAPKQEHLMTTLIEEEGEKVKQLFVPIDRSLFFVGEHTSILTDVPGTMEAACESGERAARMISKQLALHEGERLGKS